MGDWKIFCGSLTSGKRHDLYIQCIHHASHRDWDIYSNNCVSYITHHSPFMDMQPIKKKKKNFSFFLHEAKQCAVFHISAPPPSFLLCFHGSHSFSCLPPSQSQSAGRRRPVTSTWAWWTGGWGEPSNSHFRSMCFLDSPYFTPKRRHSDLFCQHHASGRLRDLLCLLCFSAEDTMWGPGSV